MTTHMHDLAAYPMPPNLPDPSQPADFRTIGNGRPRPSGKRWANHYERRSRILAAARRLIIEVGFDAVSFREIAERCGISIPTIYHTVGDRARVMAEASAEWVEWLGAAAADSRADVNAVAAVLEMFWMSALYYPEFTANAVKRSYMPLAPLYRPFRDTGTVLVCRLLADLRAKGRLRGWVDIDAFAWQLTDLVHSRICAWVTDPYDPERFRREFAFGPGLMLLGAVTEEEAERVERGLARILGHEGGPSPAVSLGRAM